METTIRPGQAAASVAPPVAPPEVHEALPTPEVEQPVHQPDTFQAAEPPPPQQPKLPPGIVHIDLELNVPAEIMKPNAQGVREIDTMTPKLLRQGEFVTNQDHLEKLQARIEQDVLKQAIPTGTHLEADPGATDKKFDIAQKALSWGSTGASILSLLALQGAHYTILGVGAGIAGALAGGVMALKGTMELKTIKAQVAELEKAKSQGQKTIQLPVGVQPGPDGKPQTVFATVDVEQTLATVGAARSKARWDVAKGVGIAALGVAAGVASFMIGIPALPVAVAAPLAIFASGAGIASAVSSGRKNAQEVATLEAAKAAGQTTAANPAPFSGGAPIPIDAAIAMKTQGATWKALGSTAAVAGLAGAATIAGFPAVATGLAQYGIMAGGLFTMKKEQQPVMIGTLAGIGLGAVTGAGAIIGARIGLSSVWGNMILGMVGAFAGTAIGAMLQKKPAAPPQGQPGQGAPPAPPDAPGAPQPPAAQAAHAASAATATPADEHAAYIEQLAAHISAQNQAFKAALAAEADPAKKATMQAQIANTAQQEAHQILGANPDPQEAERVSALLHTALCGDPTAADLQQVAQLIDDANERSLAPLKAVARQVAPGPEALHDKMAQFMLAMMNNNKQVKEVQSAAAEEKDPQKKAALERMMGNVPAMAAAITAETVGGNPDPKMREHVSELVQKVLTGDPTQTELAELAHLNVEARIHAMSAQAAAPTQPAVPALPEPAATPAPQPARPSQAGLPRT